MAFFSNFFFGYLAVVKNRGGDKFSYIKADQ